MRLRKVLVALLLVCAFAGVAFAEDAIRIGVFLPLTGRTAFGGQLELEGVQMAHKEMPSVLGKKVELVVVDNKTDKVEAANAVKRLIEKEKVVAVIGTYGSSLAMAGGEVAEKAGIPMMGTSCTNPLVTQGKKFVFRACFIDPFQGQVMATFADKTLHVKKVAILFDSSSDYSKGLAEVFQKTLEKNGGQVVAREAFLAKDIDFKAALTKIKASNPEALYVPGYYEEVSKIVKQAREIGLNVPMMGSDGWDSPKLAEIAGPAALNNCYFSSAFSSDDKDPGVQKFIKTYKDLNKKDPDVFAMQGYNAGLVLVNALKTAGTTDGTKLAAALAATKDLSVASGKFTYDKNHNPITGAIVIAMKDGKQTFKEKINL